MTSKERSTQDSKGSGFGGGASGSLVLSLPSKTFLLGEYLALLGGPTVVATFGPRFELRREAFSGEAKKVDEIGAILEKNRFHPQSPVGRLLSWAAQNYGLERVTSIVEGWSFFDPHHGAGGFGASTAQFGLIYGLLSRELHWATHDQSVYRLYRDLMSEGQVELHRVPSGADLVGQVRGGITYFNAAERRRSDLWPLMSWSELAVFSATQGSSGRKTTTHDHIAKLSATQLDRLKGLLSPIVEQGLSAVTMGLPQGFAQSMSRYAQVLSDHGLECEASRDDRQFLMTLPEVVGAKGSGAMLSDSMVVLFSRKPSDETLSQISKRGLELIVSGLPAEFGLRA
jgi:hypothetical protein